jgi:glycosyltransferase involved in cell wall biosynthesis
MFYITLFNEKGKLIMNDLISIVMPSYNTAEYISETIESVLNQSYVNWELIIVDDCSNDQTEEIVYSYKDSRIYFYKNEKNCGAAISRNKGIRLARGEWIAFLDSDDLWANNKLEKQLRFMKENSYYFSYTNYEIIDANSKRKYIYFSGPKKINEFGMYAFCWPGCLTVMFNVGKVGKIQIKDIKKRNDYAMWLKIIKKADCFLLNENLAKYRVRNNSISNVNFLVLTKYHYLLFKEVENRNIVSALILTINNIFFGA